MPKKPLVMEAQIKLTPESVDRSRRLVKALRNAALAMTDAADEITAALAMWPLGSQSDIEQTEETLG